MIKERLTGRHRRMLISLIIILFVGIRVGTLEIHFPADEVSQSTSQTLFTDRHSLSGQQSGVTLVAGPPIDDFWMQEAYQTTDRLWGAVYAISSRDAQHQLAALANEGVQVRIMLENQPFSYTNDTYEDIARIADQSPSFVLQNDEILNLNYLHSKYFIFDDRAAIVQTSNLTHAGLTRNIEHLIHISNPELIQSLAYIYDQDRYGAPLDYNEIDSRIILCPVQCRVVIEDMIESAQYSVDIMTQYIYDDTILGLLKNLDPDIKLRLLLSDSDGNYDTLDYFGDELVTIHDSDAGYLHTKTILVDERWLLVGSMNLSSNSLDRNREIGLIITDPDMINYYVNHFEQLFQGLW